MLQGFPVQYFAVAEFNEKANRNVLWIYRYWNLNLTRRILCGSFFAKTDTSKLIRLAFRNSLFLKAPSKFFAQSRVPCKPSNTFWCRPQKCILKNFWLRVSVRFLHYLIVFVQAKTAAVFIAPNLLCLSIIRLGQTTKIQSKSPKRFFLFWLTA